MFGGEKERGGREFSFLLYLLLGCLSFYKETIIFIQPVRRQSHLENKSYAGYSLCFQGLSLPQQQAQAEAHNCVMQRVAEP